MNVSENSRRNIFWIKSILLRPDSALKREKRVAGNYWEENPILLEFAIRIGHWMKDHKYGAGEDFGTKLNGVQKGPLYHAWRDLSNLSVEHYKLHLEGMNH